MSKKKKKKTMAQMVREEKSTICALSYALRCAQALHEFEGDSEGYYACVGIAYELWVSLAGANQETFNEFCDEGNYRLTEVEARINKVRLEARS